MDRSTLEPASVILQRLNDQANDPHFTIAWLLDSLEERSFAIVLILLAIVAMAPGASFPVGLILMIPAVQMMLGRRTPTFPRWIAERPLKSTWLSALVRRTVPALRRLERYIHPRWPGFIANAKRPVGAVVLLLNMAVAFIPIPFSNIPPAAMIVLIALALLEEDGVLLLAGLVAALAGLAATAALGWQALVQTNLI